MYHAVVKCGVCQVPGSMEQGRAHKTWQDTPNCCTENSSVNIIRVSPHIVGYKWNNVHTSEQPQTYLSNASAMGKDCLKLSVLTQCVTKYIVGYKWNSVHTSEQPQTYLSNASAMGKDCVKLSVLTQCVTKYLLRLPSHI